MNWGMLPFVLDEEPEFEVGDYIFIPDIRNKLDNCLNDIKAYIIKDEIREIKLYIQDMTDEEKEIIKAGSLINYNKVRKGL